MSQRSLNPRPFRSSAITALLLCASVGLNLFLATRAVRGHSALSAAAATSIPVRSSASLASSSNPQAAGSSLSSNTPPPFVWSQIESADYRQYIANLRAVGCPEQVIRDLIAAELIQLYASRAAAIWKYPVSQYWKKWSNQGPGPDQLKQLTALTDEKSAIFRELLGVRHNEQALIDTLFLQVHGSEDQLLFLPEDRRQVAMQALDDSGMADKEMKLHESDRYYEKRREIYDEKVKLLAGVLSPEELDQFKLRTSENAQNLRMETRFFNLTPDEFNQIVKAREQDAKLNNSNLDLLHRGPATEEIRELFGDERAREFARVSDMFYINARQAAIDNGLPLDRAESAWQVTADARTAAGDLAKDGSLPVAERNRQLLELQIKAEASLSELLGKASLPIRRDLRNVLGATQPNVRQ